MELAELRRLAAKEELSLNFIAKDEKMSEALFHLQGFDDIILKGGTAINRVYLKNKRFSEDIDFDLLSKGTMKDAIARTKVIIGKLADFIVSKPHLMKETIRYDLFYINPLAHKDRIMLEFTTVRSASQYQKRAVSFGFAPFEAALLNVYDPEAIISQKMDCIMKRLEGKDFFDFFYLLDLPHKPVDEVKKRKEELLLRITLEEKEIISVTNIVNHYIPRDRRPNWTLFLEELKWKIQKQG